MLQLIYTSSPRLLEAGKTGFGTVARSRQLPQSLITYLERISTYDRAAGVAALQCYSVFRMGLLVYHIFTRIGDCGVDYTKRTNHIAHHFIVQDDVVCEGPLAAVSPAAFMMSLQHKWKTQWTGNPAWIDEESEGVPAVPPAGAHWQQLTGHADNAQWLATQTCAEGANILLPAGCGLTECLGLMHEAAMQRSDKGWGMGFSTAAVSTLSSKVCPCVFLSEEQIRAGVRPRSGFPTLQVGPQLAPPTAADFPPVVQMNVPQAMEPAAPVVQELPQSPGMVPPAAPPAMAPGYPTPVPMPAMSPVAPMAPAPTPVYKPASRQEDSQSPMQKYGWGIAAGMLLIGVAVYAVSFEPESPAPRPVAPTNHPPDGGYTFSPDDVPEKGKKDESPAPDAPRQEQKDESPTPKEPRPEQKDESPAPKEPQPEQKDTPVPAPAPEPQQQATPAPQPPAEETEKTYQCRLNPKSVRIQDMDDLATYQVEVELHISAENLHKAAAGLGSIICISDVELGEGKPYVHRLKLEKEVSDELRKKMVAEQEASEHLEKIRLEYNQAPEGKKPEEQYRKNYDKLHKALNSEKDSTRKKKLQQQVDWINKQKLRSDGKAATAALNKAQKAKEEAFAAEKKKYENKEWMLRFTYQKEGAIYYVHIVDVTELK